MSLRGRELSFEFNIISLTVVMDACVRRATSVQTVFAVGGRLISNGVGRSKLVVIHVGVSHTCRNDPSSGIQRIIKSSFLLCIYRISITGRCWF